MGNGSSVVGFVVGFLGLGGRISRIEKKMDTVVYKDTFEQFEKRCDDNFEDVKELIRSKKNKEEG